MYLGLQGRQIGHLTEFRTFGLATATPLIFVLEKAEELELSAEMIVGIQTSLLLMGNANYQHSMSRWHALMTQLNPKLKQPFSHKHFKYTAPFLFREMFSALAKDRLEAAEALRMKLSERQWLQRTQKRFSERPFPEKQLRGWQPVQQLGDSMGLATKPRKGTHQRND